MKIKHVLLAASSILFISLAAHAAPLTLTGNVASGEYYINDLIQTQGTTVINSGVTLKIYAEDGISFNIGFKVESGGVLVAVASPDTDGDLILDFVERLYSCSNYLSADSDGDLLSDNQEDVNHNGRIDALETSPCTPDSDNDRMSDYWELRYGLNPLDNADAKIDSDGDGLTNYMEYNFRGPDDANPQSDPTSAASLPAKGTHYIYDELGRIKKIIRIK
ncbi:MAG: hypothetical protein KKE62_18960 [Proteobacteria bacterium]|nr:hypothetical protein [Pseudomonadota bacterium]MBU1390130.1 hypothetical protein [Pseudomonadota bacterium]MBU1544919.1 hypothetical protein [Pseudomonadota bacterium]MBU2482056.1 hypothetical protein [Pseudomonadota bacterium]